MDYLIAKEPEKSDYLIEPEPETPAQPQGLVSKAKDTAVSFGIGANSLLQMAGDFYGLATGDMGNVVSQQAKENIQYLQQRKSPELRQAEEARRKAIEADEDELGKALTYVRQTVTNPSLLSNALAEQVPNLVGTGGAGALAKAGAEKVLLKTAADQAAKRLAAKKAAQIGTGAAVGAGAAMQGTDVGADLYDEAVSALDKITDEQAMSIPEIASLMEEKEATLDEAKTAFALALGREAFALGATVSAGAQMLPGGRTIERAFVGKQAGRRLAGAITGGLGEAASEAVEEGGSRVAANLLARQFEPDRPLAKGVGEAVGQAAVVGGIPGAAFGAASSRPTTQPAPEGQTTAGKTGEAPASAATKSALAGAPEVALESSEGLTPEQFYAAVNIRQARLMGGEPDPEDIRIAGEVPLPKVQIDPEKANRAIEEAQSALQEWADSTANAPQNIRIIFDPELLHNGYGVQGYYSPDGSIAVNAAFVTPDRVASIASHEWAHQTLATPEGQQAFADFVQREIPQSELDALAARYGTQDRRVLLEEWIAENQEKAPGVIERIVARIREWLAGVGIVDLSDAEVADIMLRTLRQQAENRIQPDTFEAMQPAQGERFSLTEEQANLNKISRDEDQVQPTVGTGTPQTVLAAPAGGERTGVPTPSAGVESGAGAQAVRRLGAQPNEEVRRAADGYNKEVGMGSITHGHYVPVDEPLARQIAAAYDALPEFDESPETVDSYAALTREVDKQWDYATKTLGITFEPWAKEGQPYANSREMVKDVKENKHLYFFQGGEPHPYMNRVDPETGLTSNDKFRAVHDLFGHAAEDYQFGPRGEENAWIKHSQMFSPEAQRALSTETRGQNSWVNYGTQNYDGDQYLNIPVAERPYAKQKVALLPVELTDWRAALARGGARFSLTEQVAKGRDPVLAAEAQKLKRGETTAAKYARKVEQRMPLRPFEEVPEPATDEDILRGLANRMAGDRLKRELRANPEDIEGQQVEARLDIPSYEDANVWTVTLHLPRERADSAGKVLAYTPTAILRDVTFTVNETAAMKVAAGARKSSFATMDGTYVPATARSAYEQAVEAKESGDWVEIGMNPIRHSYFYDKADQRPVVSAEEVIQVGGLVLGRGVQYGEKSDRKFSLAQTKTPQFKSWFGDSKIVDADGNPQVMYHGTFSAKGRPEDFTVFEGQRQKSMGFTPDDAPKTIFFTPDPEFASGFAGIAGPNQATEDFPIRRPGSRVYPVYIKAENPFDFQNPEHVNLLFGDTDTLPVKGQGLYGVDRTRDVYRESVEEGRWEAIETLAGKIKAAGFDSFYVREGVLAGLDGGDGAVRNIAVFKPTQVKSATGNTGAFDPENPDIRYSLSEEPVENTNKNSVLTTELPDDLQTLLGDYLETGTLPKTLQLRVFPISSYPEIELDAESRDRGETYALKMVGSSVPPVIVANGHLLDGKHRLFAARASGSSEVPAIDLTGMVSDEVISSNSLGKLKLSLSEEPTEETEEEIEAQDPNLVLSAEAERERPDLPPTSALNTLYAQKSAISVPETGKRTNGQVAEQLRQAALKYWGRKLDSSNLNADEIERIVDNGVEEVIAGLKASNHAGNWYTTAIRKAMAIAAVLHPELSNDALAQKAGFKDAKAAEVGLSLAMAITSQNLNVEKNTEYANEQFEILKRTGRFDPSKEYGSKMEAISGNLRLANTLLDKVGWEGAEEFLNREYTVKELNEIASQVLGEDVSIAGKVDDLVNGSAIFGPKIGGGFFQNLRANFNPVTVDLWMRRTWGRWTGDVLPEPLDARRLARMLEGMREAGIQLPEQLRSIRTVLATEGRKVPTLTDKAAQRILSDPEKVNAAYDFAAEQDSRWNKMYSEVRQNITPEQAAAVRAGELSLEQLNRQQQKSIREKRDAWQNLEGRPSGSSKEGRDAQKKFFEEMDAKAGRTAKLTNKELSKYKPEWAKSSRVITTLLKPVDVPSDLDRRVIVDVVNRIRAELQNQGVNATNADIQAILWYPEKDIWAKLAGKKESKLKSSYDEEFLRVAEAQGLGSEARDAAGRVGD